MFKGMLDRDVLALCRDCLIDAVLARPTDEDLSLVATALSRDMADTHVPDAPELLTAAMRDATAALDASDLAANDFATALSRRAWLDRRVVTMLAPSVSPVRPA
jgi:hypothetical protein